MKPWMGALAVAAAMAVLPSAAVADDGVSRGAVQAAQQGDHGDVGGAGRRLRPRLHRRARAAASWSAPSSTTTRRRASRRRAIRPSRPSRPRPTSTRCAPSARPRSPPRPPRRPRSRAPRPQEAKKAAAGTVRAQRADYWEDVSGRYLSIEGTTTEAAMHAAAQLHGPAAAAAWFAADGTQLGTGQPLALLDTDVTPAAYLYHGSRFRVGDVGDGGMPAYVRDRGAQRRRRHARRQEVGRQRRHHEPRRLHPGLQHALRHAA